MTNLGIHRNREPRQQGNLISLLLFIQNQDSRLTIDYYRVRIGIEGMGEEDTRGILENMGSS
jgi:hypothetical protein